MRSKQRRRSRVESEAAGAIKAATMSDVVVQADMTRVETLLKQKNSGCTAEARQMLKEVLAQMLRSDGFQQHGVISTNYTDTLYLTKKHCLLCFMYLM